MTIHFFVISAGFAENVFIVNIHEKGISAVIRRTEAFLDRQPDSVNAKYGRIRLLNHGVIIMVL
jgi:hypothetical protein